MKAHVPTTSLHWQRLHEQARTLTVGDYEEWRNNPVTVRFFDEFEFKTFEALAILADTKPDHPSLLARHATVFSLNSVVNDIFEWAPGDIELDEEEENND